MKTTTSLYLDILRFVSAMLVILYHSGFTEIANGFPGAFGHFGNEAVMVFFVLSGYVIAYSTERRPGFSAYATARLARLWSVVVPALILTALVDYAGDRLNPAYYSERIIDNSPVAFVVSALFLNEAWSIKLVPGLNYPFWSISYEFFYYAIFAAAVHLQGIVRIVGVATLLMIAGLKIVWLLPMWLLGVATYHLASRVNIGRPVGWLLWLGSWAALIIYFGQGGRALPAFYLPQIQPLGSAFSLQDLAHGYLISALVAVNLIGFEAVGAVFLSLASPNERAIRYAASHTFSMYLFHYPLLSFFAAASWVGRGMWWSNAMIYGGTAVVILILAPISEWQNGRLASLFDSLLKRFTATCFHFSPREDFEVD